jgi:allantoin racemase
MGSCPLRIKTSTVGERKGHIMRIVILPPYQVKSGYLVKQTAELMQNLERKGLIAREEYVIDEGYWIDWPDQRRDSEFLAAISLGVVRKVREHAGMSGVDAIVCTGSMEPAFFPAREISDIPYMGALHSALHVASLLGEKCTVIEATDPQALLARRHARIYGFGDKLVSVRCPGYSSTRMGELIDADSKERRGSRPEVRRCIEAIVKQCIAAVEQDGADCLILACMPLQIFEDEIRKGLDEAGYREIPLICELSAAVALAKAVVGMKVSQARLAYPRADTTLVLPKR